MLFLLTGDIQSGKTRWLASLITELEAHGVQAMGVLAPGRWNPPGVDGVYEKIGIDNELLPGHDRVSFAIRRDLLADQPIDESDASQHARLGWAISEEALAHVNDHFKRLMGNLSKLHGRNPALLVIDELGRLELNYDQGLTAAMELAKKAPGLIASDVSLHGIFVVRPSLVDEAKKRFSPMWGEPLCITSDSINRVAVLAAYGQAFNRQGSSTLRN